jgi:hypothetical protein
MPRCGAEQTVLGIELLNKYNIDKCQDVQKI